jgi:hypothetical protein
VILTLKQIRELLAFCDDEADKDGDTEICLDEGKGHSGYGVYASFVEYPDEGSVRLGGGDD